MKHLRLWVLSVIVAFAFFVRVFNVTAVPPSLSWDEVSIGYNAYSILKTGRDEHGRFLPMDAFVAYGDYKPPFAIYLTVPFVAVFGLTELAVRLPSVIAGTVAVLLTYLVASQLLAFHLPRRQAGFSLFTSFLLAISPWHIQLSRAGWEANIALTLLLSGIWLVLGARKRPPLLIICWLPFVLAMYTFNSARYVAQFFALLFFFWIWKLMVANKRYAVTGILLGIISLAPLAPHLISPEARLRFAEVNIFSDLSIIKRSNERIAVDGGGIWANIVHNRRVGFAIEYLKHFFDHFQPWFLFIRGDGNPKFSIQDTGQLYLIEAPIFVYGFYRLFADNPKLAWTFVLWIVFALLPAGVARETPHALRIANSLPVWQIFIAYGAVSFLKKRTLHIAYCLFLIVSFSYFWHNYFNHYAKEYSTEWQYGYKEAIAKVKQLEGDYNRIVITEGYGRSYMYTLFFTQTDPETYVADKRSTFDAAGFYHVFGFGKYEFRENGTGSIERGTLYMATPKETPEQIRVFEIIKRPNGEPAFIVFDRP